MKQNGRKSGEQKETDKLIAGLNVIQGGFGLDRPKAPVDLTVRQAEIWEEIVNDEDLEHFSTAATQAMLKDYVQVRERIEKLNGTINQFLDEWLKAKEGAARFKTYSKMIDQATTSAARLATKLRLTNQSRYTPRGATSAQNNTLKGSKPWDWDPPPNGA